jgi:hypothetical protein
MTLVISSYNLEHKVCEYFYSPAISSVYLQKGFGLLPRIWQFEDSVTQRVVCG